MITYARNRGRYNIQELEWYHKTFACDNKPSLIHIAKINETCFIHDGHHRVMSKFLAGHKTLRIDEYEVVEYSRNEYIFPCLEKRWFTPFDPFWSVRLPDLTVFRESIQLMQNMNAKRQTMFDFINRSEDLYSEPRLYFTVRQMAQRLGLN
jgi:hypothetical protein